MARLSDITIDDSGLPAPTPEIEQERKVAIFDLLEDNSFVIPTRDDRVIPDGPYHLNLAIRERRPISIASIWLGGIHNEGARVLQERLEGKADIDIDTARRLFTLICVLHWGG